VACTANNFLAATMNSRRRIQRRRTKEKKKKKEEERRRRREKKRIINHHNNIIHHHIIIEESMNQCWEIIVEQLALHRYCAVPKRSIRALKSTYPVIFSRSDMADDLNAVRKFLAIKHSWRGSYNRIFKLGSNVFQTLDPKRWE
jgi:hypothetical protein